MQNLFNQKQFCADMIAFREKKQMGFRPLGAITGLTHGTLHRIEAGQMPTVADFLAICKACNLRPTKYYN